MGVGWLVVVLVLVMVMVDSDIFWLTLGLCCLSL